MIAQNVILEAFNRQMTPSLLREETDLVNHLAMVTKIRSPKSRKWALFLPSAS